MVTSSDMVSVVAVTHNSMPCLRECLESLRRSLETISHELILVDNASSDDSPSVAREIFPDSEIILNRSNMGFAAACNAGAEKARGEYLLFLNPDVKLDTDSVVELKKVFSLKNRVGAAAARMRFSDGGFQATCREFPTINNLIFSRGFFMSRWLGGRNGYTLSDSDDLVEVPAVAATMMMINRDLFRSIGGFDKRFFVYMEDTDLCLRLQRSGFKNYFVPDAGGVHLWRHGSNAGRIRRNWYHHWSMWQYFLKHFPNGFAIMLLPLLLLLNFAFSLVIVGTGSGGERE